MVVVMQAAQLKVSLKEVNDLKAALDEPAIVTITDPHGKIICINYKFYGKRASA